MKSLFLITGLLFSVQVFAQLCDGQIAQTVFTDRYDVDLGDQSMVTDLATGLVWRRCVEGYVFNDLGTVDDISDDACDPPAVLLDDDVDTDNNSDASGQIFWTWLEAFERSESEGDGWGVPNLKELVSLAATACLGPSINTIIFPDFVTITPTFTTTTDDAGVETTTFSNVETSQSSANVWTSTPVADTATSAWSLSFFDGSNSITAKPTSLFLRLVQN